MDDQSESEQGEEQSEEESFPSNEFWKEQEVELDDSGKICC